VNRRKQTRDLENRQRAVAKEGKDHSFIVHFVTGQANLTGGRSPRIHAAQLWLWRARQLRQVSRGQIPRRSSKATLHIAMQAPFELETDGGRDARDFLR